MASSFPELPADQVASFGPNGLYTPPLDKIADANKTLLQEIYGPDIVLTSNSPDGQLQMLLSKLTYDLLGLLSGLYSSFSVANAVGTVLDDRVATQNIYRKGATYTLQPIEVVINAPCNLQGLDANFMEPDGQGFTVADDLGTQYILANSQNGLVAGTYTFSFRAKDTGPITSLANTIVNAITVIAGVETVNNATSPTTVGEIGETDAELRQRHQLSPSIASVGWLNGLKARLLTVPGVDTKNIEIENNNSGTTSASGTAGHTVWVIVGGGDNTGIANVLVDTISAGCGFRGNVLVNVVDKQGISVPIRFDRPTPQTLLLEFDLRAMPSVVVGTTLANDMKAYLVANLLFTIGQRANLSNIVPIINNAIAKLAPEQFEASNVKLRLQASDTPVSDLKPAERNVQFTLTTASITINLLTT